MTRSRFPHPDAATEAALEILYRAADDVRASFRFSNYQTPATRAAEAAFATIYRAADHVYSVWYGPVEDVTIRTHRAR
jgi:hypothetical protein